VTLTRTLVEEIFLTPQDTATLRRFCQLDQGDPYSTDHAGYDRQLPIQQIPGRLRRLATSFGESLGASGAAVIHGLPVPDDLPPTPALPYFDIRRPTGTEPLLVGVGSCMGEVFAFPGWRGGDRIHNVYPMPDDVGTQKASNAVRLAFHTEAAFDPGAPEALVLLVLRGAASDPPSTGFSDLRRAFESMSSPDRSLLIESGFHPLCFDRQGNSSLGGAESIVLPWRGGLRFHYVPSMVGATPAHDEALDRFRQRIEDDATEVLLEAGDMVLIDNTHVVHGRTAQAPQFAGADRWLQRCLVRKPC
jgi:L-asparagine oxygenase